MPSDGFTFGPTSRVWCGVRAVVDLGGVSGAGRGIDTIARGRLEANNAKPKAFSNNRMYSHTLNPF